MFTERVHRYDAIIYISRRKTESEKTESVDSQIQHSKAACGRTVFESNCSIRIVRESDSKITATGTTWFVADTAFDCDPPQGAMFLGEDRQPDHGAEPIERFPEGIDGIEELPDIAVTERRDTVGRDPAELIENGIDLLRGLPPTAVKATQEISGAGGAPCPDEDRLELFRQVHRIGLSNRSIVTEAESDHTSEQTRRDIDPRACPALHSAVEVYQVLETFPLICCRLSAGPGLEGSDESDCQGGARPQAEL